MLKKRLESNLGQYSVPRVKPKIAACECCLYLKVLLQQIYYMSNFMYQWQNLDTQGNTFTKKKKDLVTVCFPSSILSLGNCLWRVSGSIWIQYAKLQGVNECVKVYVHGALQWTGLPFREYSCLIPSVFRISYTSTMTRPGKKQVSTSVINWKQIIFLMGEK